MAELQAFQAPEELMRPETSAPKSKEDLLTEQQKAAEAEVHRFDRFFQMSDVEGVALGSGFERSNPFEHLSLTLSGGIKKRVFQVLEGAGQRYENSIGTEGEFSKVENHIWSTRRKNTFNEIKGRKQGAESALATAEGFENILTSSISQVTTEWNERKAAADQFLENRGIFAKLGGLWRKKRFDRFSRKFLESLEREQAKIASSINVIKTNKKLDVKNAENRVSSALSAANDSEKQNWWTRIKNAIDDPNANAIRMAREFGIRGNNTSDLLEALKNLGYVEGVANMRKSEALSHDANEKLERFHLRESGVRTAPTARGFDRLRDTLRKDLAIKPDEAPAVSTKSLTQSIEQALTMKGVNLLDEVYHGESIDGLTSVEKLYYFIDFLNDGTNRQLLETLPRLLQRQIIRFIEDIENKTKNDFENVDRINNLEGQAEEVRKRLNSSIRGQAVMPPKYRYAQNLSDINTILSTTTFDQNEFDVRIRNFRHSLEIFDRHTSNFEEQKEKLSKEDRERLEEIWKELRRAKDKALQIVEKWEDDAKKCKALIDRLPSILPPNAQGPFQNRKSIAQAWINHLEQLATTARNNRNTSATTQAGQAGGQGGQAIAGPSAQALANQVAAFDREIQGHENKIDALRNNIQELDNFNFSEPDSFTRDITGLSNIRRITTPGRPTTPPPPTLNQLIHDRLFEEFKDDIEKSYMAFLDQNISQQWDILHKVPDGATINLTFRNNTNTGTLSMPADLQTNRQDVSNLRIIRRIEGVGVILEDNNHFYVLNGPSISGTKANLNLGVYEKQNPRGTPATSPIGPRTSPNDIMIPHKNPNQTATILNMQIF